MNLQNLKRIREFHNLSQKEAAERLNIPYTRYNHYESGRNEPDNATLGILANFYGVSVDYLLGRTENTQSEKKEPVELTTDSVMYELKKRGLYDKLNAMSDDDRQAVLATLDTLCEQLGKNRK